uniref:ladderlectin-like n=1 Tax=Centroberyx gerrardi TaxID=166262 RepID=UPI003AAD86FE
MMLIVSILLCATFALKGNAEVRTARGSCAAGWTLHGSRCFIFYNSPKTWIQAEQHCLTLGGNLASIHSLEEYQFIRELVRSSSGSYPATLIGGTDAFQENLWMWTDGSKFDYQLWASGEPNNDKGAEHCIDMNYREG